MTVLDPVAAIRRKLLTRKEAAEYLGFKTQTLAKWASDGNYDLPVVHLGGAVRYRLADLEAFIERHTLSGAEV